MLEGSQPTPLRIEALPPNGDLQRYQVSGRVTLPGMLALEQAIAELPGVSYAMVSPAPQGDRVTVLVRSDDAQSLLRAISNLPTFNFEAGPS
jgi:hypothetical protein